MGNKMSYSTPEGYFDDLEKRLSGIPSAVPARKNPAFRASPLLALAASFVIALLAGNFILGKTAGKAASEEEIIEYLIESGTTIAQIEDYYLNY